MSGLVMEAVEAVVDAVPDRSNAPFKLLLDPVYTNKQMSKCSTWYVLQEATRHLLKKFPNMYVYAVTPEADSWCTPDALFTEEEQKRVLHVPLEQYRDRFKEYYFLKKSWIDCFAYWGTHWDWDVCLTVRTVGVPTIRVLSTKGIRKRIAIFEPLPLVSTKKTVNMFSGDGIGDEMQMQTFTGYMNADMVAVNAKHEIDGIVSEARRFLSPAKIQDLKQRLVCEYSAPSVDLTFPYRKPKREPGAPLKVLYTQRLDKTERRPDQVFDSFRYAFITSADKITFRVCTNTAGGEFAHFQDFMMFKRPARDEFYDELATAHVCCSFAIEEGLPLSLFEAACFGVICIVKKEPWSKDMYGPDYPWIVPNIEGAVVALKWIEANYEEAYEKYMEWYETFWLRRVAERGGFQDHFVKVIKDDFLAKRDEVVEKKRHPTKNRDSKRLSTIVHDYCMEKKITKFDMGETAKEMDRLGLCESAFRSTLTRNQFDIPLSRSPAFYETRLELLHWYGWKDTLQPGVFAR